MPRFRCASGHEVDQARKPFKCPNCGNPMTLADGGGSLPSPPASSTPSHSTAIAAPPPPQPPPPPVRPVLQNSKSAEIKQPPQEDFVGPNRVSKPAGVPASPEPASSTASRVVWRYPNAPGRPLDAQRNSPAVDASGNFYFCTQNAVASFKFEGCTLAERWVYETGGRIPGSPIVGSDGLIRVHSTDGSLHTLSSGDGRRACSPFPVGAPLGWCTPAIDQSNAVYVNDCTGGVRRVEAQERAGVDTFFRSKQRFDSTGLIYEGAYYVGAENGCVYAIGIEEGRGENRWDHFEDRGRTGWYISSALAMLPGPAVLVASQDDCLYAFDLAGRRLWSEAVGGKMLGAPVVDSEGSVFVGLSITAGGEPPRGAFIRLDAHTHKERWRLSIGAPVESTPVIGDDGMIYFGDNDGWIHAVTLAGDVVWKEQVAAGVRSAGAIAAGHVFFGLENGQFVALACESREVHRDGWPKFRRDPSQAGLVTTGSHF